MQWSNEAGGPRTEGGDSVGGEKVELAGGGRVEHWAMTPGGSCVGTGGRHKHWAMTPDGSCVGTGGSCFLLNRKGQTALLVRRHSGPAGSPAGSRHLFQPGHQVTSPAMRSLVASIGRPFPGSYTFVFRWVELNSFCNEIYKSYDSFRWWLLPETVVEHSQRDTVGADTNHTSPDWTATVLRWSHLNTFLNYLCFILTFLLHGSLR